MFLSMTIIARPLAFSLSRHNQISLRIKGASPSVASSRINSRGLVISARPMASICCSPPDRCVPRLRSTLLQPREKLVDALQRPRLGRLVAVRRRWRRGFRARSGSGRSAVPRAPGQVRRCATRCGGLAERTRPATTTRPARRSRPIRTSRSSSCPCRCGRSRSQIRPARTSSERRTAPGCWTIGGFHGVRLQADRRSVFTPRSLSCCAEIRVAHLAVVADFVRRAAGITRPYTSTVMRSASENTASMSCSTSKMCGCP